MNVKYIGIGDNFATWQFSDKEEIEDFIATYTKSHTDLQKYTLSINPYVTGVFDVEERAFLVIIAESTMSLQHLTDIFFEQDISAILVALKSCTPQT